MSARLTELFNCNNFVVSQVNPHVNFVLHLAEEGTGRRGSGRRGRSYDRRAAVTKLLRVANFLLLNIKYGAQKLLEVDLLNLRMVRTLQGILVQDFRGHITVLPELRVKDYVRVLQQPSAEDMAAFIAAGERADVAARRGHQARHRAGDRAPGSRREATRRGEANVAPRILTPVLVIARRTPSAMGSERRPGPRTPEPSTPRTRAGTRKARPSPPTKKTRAAAMPPAEGPPPPREGTVVSRVVSTRDGRHGRAATRTSPLTPTQNRTRTRARTRRRGEASRRRRARTRRTRNTSARG